MTPDELNTLVMQVFGPRGNKSNTSALCALENYPDVLIGAVQGGTFKQRPEGFGDVRDARTAVDSGRKKGEWSGYHAEMMIVNALLGYLKIKTSLTLSAIKVTLEEKAGQVVICADAPCCKHCGNVLDALGILYHGQKGAAGLTGWWNPFTDGMIPNGDLAFGDAIPTAPRGYGY